MKKFIVSILAGILLFSGSIYALPKGDTNTFCQSQGTSMKRSSGKKAAKKAKRIQRKKLHEFRNKKGRH